jgi:hypothetical protein
MPDNVLPDPMRDPYDLDDEPEDTTPDTPDVPDWFDGNPNEYRYA